MATTDIEPVVRWPWLTWNLIECYDHGIEFVPVGVYQVCGECFHVYPTAQSLLDAHNEIVVSRGEPPRTELGNLAFFCAMCVHDF